MVPERTKMLIRCDDVLVDNDPKRHSNKFISESTPSYRISIISSLDDNTTMVSEIPQQSSNLSKLQKHVFIDLLSHDKDIVTTSLKEIQELCEPPNPEMIPNRILLYRVGIHAVLLLVMKKWCFCSVVTTIGFRVLHYGATQKEFAIAIVQIGLLQIILMGMKSFPFHRLLQQAGCGVLYTMASVSTNVARIVLIETDGLKFIVQALHTFPADTYLQRCASDAMSIFASRKDLQVHFRASKLPHVLVQSILMDCRNELNARELDDSNNKNKKPKATKHHFLPK
jgi:hypothetical protein